MGAPPSAAQLVDHHYEHPANLVREVFGSFQSLSSSEIQTLRNHELGLNFSVGASRMTEK
jgi:hypothetical protein